MHFAFTLSVLAVALALDAAVGYPAVLYRALGHPVTWIGAVLTRLEGLLNRVVDSFDERRQWGMLALALLIDGAAGIAILVQYLMPGGVWGICWIGILASSLIAQRSLHEHVAAVAAALETEGLLAGRKAVSMIVGRNTEMLDVAGVSRAAIESLAENFSDGVVAPAFWIVVAGLPGGVAYKAANTADSMIGHRNERYEAFGWTAARFDDLVNLPASRLSVVWIFLAALVLEGPAAAGAATKSVWKDARRHRSPNAGWPEAAFAGALDLQLAGPRMYGSELVLDSFMGSGRRTADANDIRRALRLYRGACIAQFIVVAVAAAFLAWRS